MYFLHTNDYAYHDSKFICTCGKTFHMPDLATTDNYSYEKRLRNNPSRVRCPNCGSIYGGLWMVRSRIRSCSLHSVEDVPGDDSRLIIKKEILSLDPEADDVTIRKVQSYETTIARAPTFGV